MKQDSMDRLISGYKNFYEKYLDKAYDDYRYSASKGQNPRIIMINCCDSRVDPAILTDSGLGEIFKISNVANLVPPYTEDPGSYQATFAALEFAMGNLNIEHIIILGHSDCGGIKALMEANKPNLADISYGYIQAWMSIATKAHNLVMEQYPQSSHEQQLYICEKQALLVSLENLRSLPCIKPALAEGRLKLHAWHFNIKTGIIEAYSKKRDEFVPLLNDHKKT